MECAGPKVNVTATEHQVRGSHSGMNGVGDWKNLRGERERKRVQDTNSVVVQFAECPFAECMISAQPRKQSSVGLSSCVIFVGNRAVFDWILRHLTDGSMSKVNTRVL